MICKLLLEKAKSLNLKKVIITCNDTNIKSENIIKTNGGEYLESDTDKNNNTIKRYNIIL